MSSGRPSLWFRLGYELERARRVPPLQRLKSLKEHALALSSRNEKDAGPRLRGQRPPRHAPDREREPFDALVTAGLTILADRALGLLPPRGRPGLRDVVRALAAGGAAALLRRLAHPALHGHGRSPDALDVGETMLDGAARGLVYAYVVEPRLRGPSAARGILYASATYAVAPLGGLVGVMGGHVPRLLAWIERLTADEPLGDDEIVDHMVFGLSLALLYGIDDDV